MCGIFGYIGQKRETAQMVMTGLKLLEYRGYDSWGIAVSSKGEIKIDKHAGKIGTAKVSLPTSSIGIGHTRWATHGGVTDQNAHPHLDCSRDIALIHNGIVENYLELKSKLQKKAHKFCSETDTEIIVHLLEEKLRNNSLQDAVRQTFMALHGLNAIVVLHKPSNTLVACKNGSPLVIGEGENEYFIASDVSGIIDHTQKVLFLKDYEMITLNKKAELYDLKTGNRLQPVFEVIDWKIEKSHKGKYKHYMLKEIHEQPAIILNIASTMISEAELLAHEIKQAKGTFLIGAGTAYHACLSGVYLFAKQSSTHINTALASEFNYLEGFLQKKSLVVALSQSGETIDVIEPLQRAQKKGARIVALVNSLGSSIYRMAEVKILLGAGPEQAVASTKAYIAKVSLLLMAAYALSGRLEEGVKILKEAASEVERQLLPKNVSKIKNLAALFKNSEHLYILGRGMSYPSALEAALKIKEVSYIHTEGLAGGELKHGTLALITTGTPCIVLAAEDETHGEILSNAMEVRARGGIIIGVGGRREAVYDYWIESLGQGSIITQAIPMQLLAYYLALYKKLDPDKPRNLAKSVTVK